MIVTRMMHGASWPSQWVTVSIQIIRSPISCTYIVLFSHTPTRVCLRETISRTWQTKRTTNHILILVWVVSRISYNHPGHSKVTMHKLHQYMGMTYIRWLSHSLLLLCTTIAMAQQKQILYIGIGRGLQIYEGVCPHIYVVLCHMTPDCGCSMFGSFWGP